MSEPQHVLPLEITARVLTEALGPLQDNCTFVVITQRHVLDLLRYEQFNTLLSAMQLYNAECAHGGCAVIYQRLGDRLKWLSPFLNTTFPQFIDRVVDNLELFHD